MDLCGAGWKYVATFAPPASQRASRKVAARQGASCVALGLVEPAQLVHHRHAGGKQGGLVAVDDLDGKASPRLAAADHLNAVGAHTC